MGFNSAFKGLISELAPLKDRALSTCQDVINLILRLPCRRDSGACIHLSIGITVPLTIRFADMVIFMNLTQLSMIVS